MSETQTKREEAMMHYWGERWKKKPVDHCGVLSR